MSALGPLRASPCLAIATLLLTYLYCPGLVSEANSQKLQASRQPIGPKSPCPHAIRVNTNYQYRNTLHFICLQLQANSRPRLDVIQYANHQLVWSKEVDELDTNQMASFVDDRGTLRILMAVPTAINGTSMYSIDASGRSIDEKHTINAQLVSTMTIWKLELNWQWHLAIANQPHIGPLIGDNMRNSRKPLPQLGPMISIHSWRSTYFDRYQIIELPYDGRVNKLEPMHIYDQEFLIVAMESHNHDTNSLIYKLDFSDGSLNWVLYQNLVTKLALDASSFSVTHKASLQRDYYIALIGKVRSTADSNMRPQYLHNQTAAETTSEHGLIIYKYFGDKFVVTNSISVPGVTKLDTISYGTGDSYVVIALLNGWSKQISLFLFDGLNLKPLPGPSSGADRGPQMPPSYSRYRRTMDTDSLHLFNVPPSLVIANDSTSKRTLSDELVQPAIPLPALVFSSIPETNLSDSIGNETATRETLYEISVDQHIKDSNSDIDVASTGSAGPDSSHTKRNFISTGQDLLGWCNAQVQSILSDNFRHAASQLSSLPRVDQPGPIEIKGDLIIEGDLHVSNLLFVNRIENHEYRRVQIESSPDNASSTFREIERAHSDIDSLKKRIDQILVDDGTIQEVYTPLKFDRIVFECLNSDNINPRLQPVPLIGVPSCPQVGEIRTQFLNTRDIRDIRRQALLTGRAMRVGYDVRFEHLVLRGQTKILDTLNGLPIDEIVFGRGQSTGPIIGFKNLQRGLYSTAHLGVDNWNGFMVNRQTHLTSTGDQRIDANLNFNHVIIDNNLGLAYNSSSRIELLNGLHLDSHIDQIAQTDMSNEFKVPLFIDELIINGPANFLPNSLISSINIENLWATTMFKHSHQNVTAPMEFSGDVHVSYGGDITVDGLVNRVPMRPGDVMMRNGNYDLPNPFVFEGDLNIRELQVEVDFNGIQVLYNTETGRKELALLYDGGNQILSGDKIFNELHLGGNNYITTINGHLNLTQLYSLTKNDGVPFRFTNVRLKSRNIGFADNAPIQIDSLINGIPVGDVCSLATRLAQLPANQYERLRFEQPVTFKTLRCAAINGFNNLRSSFLMKHGNQHVAGTLKLVNGVVFNSTVQIGSSFNRINVGPLAKVINQVINESRTGHKDYYGDLYIDDLIATRINDLPLSSVFVTKADYPQIVTAPMRFDHLDIENVLVVGRDLFASQFNGMNMTDMITNTLQYDAPQDIYNHVEVDNLHIIPGVNFETKSLNGHDLSRLYQDSVVVDVPQQILAPKIFRGEANFADRVFLRFGIDGLSENELKFNLLLQSDELIEDDLEFNNDVTIMKSLEIQTGIINDVDVNLFVNSMLYESRPNGLRVLANSSLRFKDVQLNNLVVTGTIQGIDLSRDALQKGDNTNGSYDMDLRQHQIMNNNQQIFNRLYNTGTSFKVQTNNRNETLIGTCNIHSCPQTTPLIPISKPQQVTHPIGGQLPLISVTRPVYQEPPQPFTHAPLIPYSPVLWTRPQPIIVQQPKANVSLPVPNLWLPRPQQQFMPRPVVMPNPSILQSPVIMPRPLNLINTSIVSPVWKPVQVQTIHQPHAYQVTNATTNQNQFPLVDPKYLEFQAKSKAQAISDLIFRVNKYLQVSFYYEIVQKHPALGPVMHATSNPIPGDQGSAWLLLKSASKWGEPCLQRNQKISVMAAQPRHKGSKPSFTVNSLLQETSNPAFVESVVAGSSHYLFVADSYPESNIETMSQILVYLWDYKSGMYDLREKIPIDGFPTALKAFVVNQRACIALANPRVVQSNHTGAPLFFCQSSPMSSFSQRIVLPMNNIFDLDIITLPMSGQIVVAALSQQNTEQIGDLIAGQFDINTRTLFVIAKRRTARPLKLHFIKQTSSNIQLVVSEGITSNDAVEASTRIYSLRFSGTLVARDGRLIESQIIRDNQFTDIQSIILDANHSMVFLQSTHSISIYAQMSGHSGDLRCESQFTLIQRLPTKGANKFLVFNDNLHPKVGASPKPFEHSLVLSRDDCEHQQYSTIILRPKITA